MPIYEYQCQQCHHQVEAFQKINEAPLTACPNCHKNALQKLVSASSFQLKGTGWYATDFRDKGKAPKKEEEVKKESKETPKGSNKKSDESSSS